MRSCPLSVLVVSVVTPMLLALPGCIFVSSSRSPATPRALMEQTREVDPGAGAPTFRSEHREQLAKVTPGMGVEAFRGVFPEAVFVERYEDQGRMVDVYSVEMSVMYHYRDGVVVHTAEGEGRFYFHEGKLEKWKERGS